MRITLACGRISEEIGYPYASPICVALSSQHYWTSPYVNIIVEAEGIEVLERRVLIDIWGESTYLWVALRFGKVGE